MTSFPLGWNAASSDFALTRLVAALPGSDRVKSKNGIPFVILSQVAKTPKDGPCAPRAVSVGLDLTFDGRARSARPTRHVLDGLLSDVCRDVIRNKNEKSMRSGVQFA